jgi:hypothetical protein
VHPCASCKVRVANGEIMYSDTMVRSLEWWANGHTYQSDMRVLGLGAYDAILGYDWLRRHSPMQCDWEGKVIGFVDKGVEVQLVGISNNRWCRKYLPYKWSGGCAGMISVCFLCWKRCLQRAAKRSI